MMRSVIFGGWGLRGCQSRLLGVRSIQPIGMVTLPALGLFWLNLKPGLWICAWQRRKLVKVLAQFAWHETQ